MRFAAEAAQHSPMLQRNTFVMRGALWTLVALVASALAHAQPPRVTVTVSLPIDMLGPRLLLLAARHLPPFPDEAEIPPTARTAYAAWRQREAALHLAAAEANRVGLPATDDLPKRLARLEADSDVAAARLATALELLPSPTPAARLVLGELRYRAATRNLREADAAHDACEASGRPDCGAPPLPDPSLAVEVWRGVPAADPRGGWAAYEVGFALRSAERTEEARSSLEAAFAHQPHDPTLAAASAFELGQLVRDSDAAPGAAGVAATWFERASLEAIAPYSSLGHAARADVLLYTERSADALRDVAILLRSADTRDDALQRLGIIVYRAASQGSAVMPSTLDAADRARALTTAGLRHQDEGNLRWARADLAAALALASDPDIRSEVERAVQKLPEGSQESGEHWLFRAAKWCVWETVNSGGRPDGSVEVTVTARKGQVYLHVDAQHGQSLNAVAQCLTSNAPPPESTSPPTLRARLVYTTPQ